MAKNKIGLQFTGWKELVSNIEKTADEAAMKEAVEGSLKATKGIVNSKVKKAMSKSNLPAKGKYSRVPHVIDSLDQSFDIIWSGYTGSINVGFDIEGKGLVSVFLMYGTPKMKPVNELRDAFYGKKTKKEIREIQKEAINKYIQRKLGG